MESDGRKHPVHRPVREQFNTPIIIFLTVCRKARKPILVNASAHQLLREVWQTQPSWLVGRYVIMPDHIHLFCAPADLIPQPLTEEKWEYVLENPIRAGLVKQSADWPYQGEINVLEW